MQYHIVTYGCQMNVHESEKIAGILQKMGYTYTDKRKDADVIVFNTCAIREGAEDRAFGNIGALKQQKKENPNKLNEELISIIKSWNEKKINKEFVLYKYEDEYALFIDDYNIYYVKGLEERIRDMIPEQKLPIFVKTVLLPLNDNIIYDSYIQQYNVSLGNNLRKIWHDNYKKLLKENKIKFKL